ncbi:YifB family Mg chelatase-like AAA ATPase [Jatrophihabitans sp. YIM 134969]
MAVAATSTVVLRGVSGQVVRVEADLSNGIPTLAFTGLAGTSITEARDRIRSAVTNAGIGWPNRRITVALLPADLRKTGSHLDLALALAVLATADEIPSVPALETTVWLAELGLDGALRPVRGVLPAVLAAREAGIRRVVVAHANGPEAALVEGVEVRTAAHLAQVLASLPDGTALPRAERAADAPLSGHRPDLADVAGQPLARRAIEVAAAGGHHVFLQGVPGSGKTMLAERLPGLLPALSDRAALEVTAVHSVAGRLAADSGLVRHAPFQAPHHSATTPSMVGGGSHLATPGAISLAHHGVLFLDEAPQFDVATLDALRAPLESGTVTVNRSGGTVTYPARFQLVLAANPCPCGRPQRSCECLPATRRRYADRLSRPLLDRVDIRVWVDPVRRADLFTDPVLAPAPESTAVVAARVATARAAARERWAGVGWGSNAEADGPTLRRLPWRPAAGVLRAAERLLDAGTMSTRGLDKVLRLAWTLADLEGAGSPTVVHVDDAMYLRTGRDQGWAA